MFKNPWFTLILGLIVGLAVGYVLAERQAVPRGRVAPPQANQGGAVPEDHPPMPMDGTEIAKKQRLQQEAAELESLIAQSPDDSRLMTALGNLYYDAIQWPAARVWYERAIALNGGNPDVLTDLAVVYRNLGEPERALASLDRASDLAPEHWQAVYNKVVVLHFDLHRHEDAAKALARLQELAQSNSAIPDLSGLEKEVLGS